MSAASIAGCLGSDEPSLTSTDGPPFSDTGTPTGDPQSTSETPPSGLTMPSEPMELSPRQYVTYSQRPSATPLPDWGRVTSVRPVIMQEHSDAFGGSYRFHRDNWYPTLMGVPLPKASLSVATARTVASLLQFDQDEFVSHFEYYNVSSFGTYRGFELYGDKDGGAELYAAKSPVLLYAHYSDHEKNRRSIKHLIDLHEGVTTPYFEVNDNCSTIVEHLPQEAMTRLYPKLLDVPRMTKADVESAGQTLSFDTERSPAEGRTVLLFEESVDPKKRTRSLVTDSVMLLGLPLNDPIINQVGPRTTIVTDTVDPSESF